MNFQSPNIIKISAKGDHMPATATKHAAVLYPDFGIMFAVKPKGFASRSTFDDAAKRAADLKHAGETGWILAPDVRLHLLTVDYSRLGPAADPDLYPDMQNSWYWTAHGCEWAKDDAGAFRAFWRVYAYSGGVNYDNRYGHAFARPCRLVAPAGQ
jgi:hypothetical protein